MRRMWSGASQAYINPLNFHLQGMLWSGDFVAKGEKGDCIALQEDVGAHTPCWVTPRLIRKFVSGAMGQNSLRGVRVSQNPLFCNKPVV